MATAIALKRTSTRSVHTRADSPQLRALADELDRLMDELGHLAKTDVEVAGMISECLALAA